MAEKRAAVAVTEARIFGFHVKSSAHLCGSENTESTVLGTVVAGQHRLGFCPAQSIIELLEQGAARIESVDGDVRIEDAIRQDWLPAHGCRLAGRRLGVLIGIRQTLRSQCIVSFAQKPGIRTRAAESLPPTEPAGHVYVSRKIAPPHPTLSPSEG